MSFYITPYPYRYAHRLARAAANCNPAARFSLALDLREEDEEFVIQALAPGLKTDDLNVQVLEDVVSIEGEFKQDEAEYLLQELPRGSFRRSVRLPAPVQADKVQARIADGVLTLRLPKAESARPRTIKVNVK
jgi:HSP20 family protein